MATARRARRQSIKIAKKSENKENMINWDAVTYWFWIEKRAGECAGHGASDEAGGERAPRSL
jgi:hypothetical protein